VSSDGHGGAVSLVIATQAERKNRLSGAITNRYADPARCFARFWTLGAA
jgi:hypothetical protein